MTTPSTEERPVDPTAGVSAALLATRQWCGRFDRRDLEAAVVEAAQRLERQGVVVGVVGDFKSGKSSLVNALVGEEVSPVDDDLATCSVLVVGHGPERRASVRRPAGDEVITEAVTLERLADLVSERGNPDNRLGVEVAQVAIPAEVLESGLVLVDTPGIGSLSVGARTAATGFLREADALLFVTDAATEFSGPEVDFLRRASAECPSVIVVLTKIDLYPHWRRIRALNRQHLAAAGLDLSMIVTSSVLRWEALERGDGDLDAESGFRSLLALLRDEVADPVANVATRHALYDCRRVLGELDRGLEAATAPLEDPTGACMRRLREAEERLRWLRSEGGRWQTALNDGIVDLRSEAGSAVQTAMRELSAEAEQTIDSTRGGHDWAAFQEWLRARTGETVQSIIDDTRSAADLLVQQIATELDDEVPELAHPDTPDGRDDRIPEPAVAQKSGAVATGLSTVRGVQGGAFTALFLCQLFGLAAATPIALGVGAIFATQQRATERKTRTERYRVAAKAAVRKHLDQVRIQLASLLESFVRDRQRALRDHFTGRVGELSTTYTAALKEAQGAVEQEAGQRQQILDRVRTERRSLFETLAAIERLESTLAGGAALSPSEEDPS